MLADGYPQCGVESCSVSSKTQVTWEGRKKDKI